VLSEHLSAHSATGPASAAVTWWQQAMAKPGQALSISSLRSMVTCWCRVSPLQQYLSMCTDPGRACAAPGTDDAVCTVSSAHCACHSAPCWLGARAWPVLRHQTAVCTVTLHVAFWFIHMTCFCAALQAVMMPCQQGSWESRATRQPLSAAMQ
jgi:hypothetical protein